MDPFAQLTLQSILLVMVVALVSLLVQILILREGVRAGLRAHQLWLEKSGRAASPRAWRPEVPPAAEYRPITPEPPA